VERPHVEDGAGVGLEVDAAARVRRHRVEVAGVEREGLAVAGRGDVGDVLPAEAGLLQDRVVGLLGELVRIALADALRRAAEPARLALARLEQRRLHAAGTDVDACRDRHGVSPRAYAWTARRANAAPPRAPV
jgi:hypothetical protein